MPGMCALPCLEYVNYAWHVCITMHGACAVHIVHYHAWHLCSAMLGICALPYLIASNM